MNEDLLDYFVRMMRPLFPMNACIVSGISGGDYIIQIDWKLEDSLLRQNKRSRKINIKISENAIEDYLDHKKEQGELYDGRIKNLIYRCITTSILITTPARRDLHLLRIGSSQGIYSMHRNILSASTKR